MQTALNQSSRINSGSGAAKVVLSSSSSSSSEASLSSLSSFATAPLVTALPPPPLRRVAAAPDLRALKWALGSETASRLSEPSISEEKEGELVRPVVVRLLDGKTTEVCPWHFSSPSSQDAKAQLMSEGARESRSLLLHCVSVWLDVFRVEDLEELSHHDSHDALLADPGMTLARLTPDVQLLRTVVELLELGLWLDAWTSAMAFLDVVERVLAPGQPHDMWLASYPTLILAGELLQAVQPILFTFYEAQEAGTQLCRWLGQRIADFRQQFGSGDTDMLHLRLYKWREKPTADSARAEVGADETERCFVRDFRKELRDCVYSTRRGTEIRP